MYKNLEHSFRGVSNQKKKKEKTQIPIFVPKPGIFFPQAKKKAQSQIPPNEMLKKSR